MDEVVSETVCDVAVVDVRRRGASRSRLSRHVDRSKMRLERKKLPLYDTVATSLEALKLPAAEEKHRRGGV